MCACICLCTNMYAHLDVFYKAFIYTIFQNVHKYRMETANDASRSLEDEDPFTRVRAESYDEEKKIKKGISWWKQHLILCKENGLLVSQVFQSHNILGQQNLFVHQGNDSINVYLLFIYLFFLCLNIFSSVLCIILTHTWTIYVHLSWHFNSDMFSPHVVSQNTYNYRIILGKMSHVGSYLL